ncbi:MAG: polysaccharide biosynthesis/export family protein [Flavobacteriales bacterium]
MKYLFSTLLIILFGSCSTKNQLVYLQDSNKNNISKLDHFQFKNSIKPGDILKIDVLTIIPEAALPYNKKINQISSQNIDELILDGYLVDDSSMINFPILGKISVNGLSENDIEAKMKSLLLEGNHLTNPTVKVKRLNSKFTVLGEVQNAGTFTYYDQKLNIFQALGYAGDLLITAKRKNIKLIRHDNGLRKTYIFSLNNGEIFDKPFYYIKSNDVIIVEPNFNKIKSAGFIGSPSSIASISSILLSITLLIINN